MTHDLYQYAYEHHPVATDGEGPGDRYDSDVNHPWKVGANLDMFASSSAAPARAVKGRDGQIPTTGEEATGTTCQTP